MTLQEVILEYKQRSGLSTSQIALKLGVARSTVMRWEKGEVTQITSKVCAALSKTVGYDVTPLLKGNDGRIKIPELTVFTSIAFKTVPAFFKILSR